MSFKSSRLYIPDISSRNLSLSGIKPLLGLPNVSRGKNLLSAYKNTCDSNSPSNSFAGMKYNILFSYVLISLEDQFNISLNASPLEFLSIERFLANSGLFLDNF